MKKILVMTVMTVASMFIATQSYAQFNVGAGYALGVQKEGVKVNGKLQKSHEAVLLNGLYISVGYNVNLVGSSWGEISVNPALKYNYFTDSEDFARSYWEPFLYAPSYDEHYLSVPIDFKYSYEFGGSDVKLSLTTGPVFSVGLFAGLEFNDHATYVGDVNMYNGKYYLKDALGNKLEGTYEDFGGYGRFDFRWGVGATVEIHEDYLIKAGYDFGLVNRCAKMSGGKVMRHDEFYFGVAFVF